MINDQQKIQYNFGSDGGNRVFRVQRFSVDGLFAKREKWRGF
jgi:hypothetical protein